MFQICVTAGVKSFDPYMLRFACILSITHLQMTHGRVGNLEKKGVQSSRVMVQRMKRRGGEGGDVTWLVRRWFTVIIWLERRQDVVFLGIRLSALCCTECALRQKHFP